MVNSDSKKTRWWQPWCFKTVLHKPVGDVMVAPPTVYYRFYGQTQRGWIIISSWLINNKIIAHIRLSYSCRSTWTQTRRNIFQFLPSTTSDASLTSWHESLLSDCGALQQCILGLVVCFWTTNLTSCFLMKQNAFSSVSYCLFSAFKNKSLMSFFKMLSWWHSGGLQNDWTPPKSRLWVHHFLSGVCHFPVSGLSRSVCSGSVLILASTDFSVYLIDVVHSRILSMELQSRRSGVELLLPRAGRQNENNWIHLLTLSMFSFVSTLVLQIFDDFLWQFLQRTINLALIMEKN